MIGEAEASPPTSANGALLQMSICLQIRARFLSFGQARSSTMALFAWRRRNALAELFSVPCFSNEMLRQRNNMWTTCGKMWG